MEHTPILDVIVTALVSFMLSGGGFWAYLQHKDEERDHRTRLLMGLASDKLTFLGLRYVDRGWIYQDEYEDLRKYLYDPYVALGGNGSAERIVHAVERLPIRSSHILDTPIRSSDRTAEPEDLHVHEERPAHDRSRRRDDPPHRGI